MILYINILKCQLKNKMGLQSGKIIIIMKDVYVAFGNKTF